MVRCREPLDAPLRAEAIESSLRELRPWMRWAAEKPRSLDDRVALLRRFRGPFDLDQDYSLFRDGYAEAPVAAGELEAYEARGAPVN